MLISSRITRIVLLLLLVISTWLIRSIKILYIEFPLNSLSWIWWVTSLLELILEIIFVLILLLLNDKILRDYLNFLLLYSTLLMISLTIYYFILSCKKNLLMALLRCLLVWKLNGFNQIYKDKDEIIFSHNKFSCFLYEFKNNNDNLDF